MATDDAVSCDTVTFTDDTTTPMTVIEGGNKPIFTARKITNGDRTGNYEVSCETTAENWYARIEGL